MHDITETSGRRRKWHDVGLVTANYVRPLAKGQKSDFRYAEIADHEIAQDREGFGGVGGRTDPLPRHSRGISLFDATRVP